MSLGFLKNYKKKVDKMKGVSTHGKPPSFWISTGNYVINKVVSGSFKRGIAQGRMASLAGPSGAGKSFLAGNIVRSAQEQGYGVLVVDTENALDDDYMEAVGVDVDKDDYIYTSCNTITNATDVIGSFLADLRDSGSEHKFLIVIDSLDMMLTDSDVKNYDKQDIKGDQGQQAKQLKKFLTLMMHDIKTLNVAMLCTKQVYAEQDPIQKLRFPWKFTDAIKFAFSQIFVITRLLLKNDKTKKFDGIILQVFGFKTRFTKPFQKIDIEVPYDGGMDEYSGIIDAGVNAGIIEKNGSWYIYGDNKFQKGTSHKYQEEILEKLCEMEDNVILDYDEDAEDRDTIMDKTVSDEEKTMKKRRKKAKTLAEKKKKKADNNE